MFINQKLQLTLLPFIVIVPITLVLPLTKKRRQKSVDFDGGDAKISPPLVELDEKAILLQGKSQQELVVKKHPIVAFFHVLWNKIEVIILFSYKFYKLAKII
jgi:hypothetical protein